MQLNTKLVAVCLGSFACAMLVYAFLHTSGFSGTGSASSQEQARIYNIYVVYSSYCPHCHHLLDFLHSLNIRVHEIPVSEFPKLKVYSNLSKYFTGVPFIFAKINNSFVIIQGFPAASQDVNGYFYGKEYEEKMCLEMHGKPVIINGTYRFCELKDNVYLGNRYSVLWLLDQCKRYGCQPIGE